MARRKIGDTVATPTRRPDLTKIATGDLQVFAQGALLKDDDRLIVAVRVLDADGAPVVGLKKANFKLFQLGHLFGDMSNFFVVELGTIAGLEGMYHLVRKNWSLVPNGTIPFYVRAQKGAARSGGVMTFVVKVRDGLDA